jgi:hypothetical protein
MPSRCRGAAHQRFLGIAPRHKTNRTVSPRFAPESVADLEQFIRHVAGQASATIRTSWKKVPAKINITFDNSPRSKEQHQDRDQGGHWNVAE